MRLTKKSIHTFNQEDVKILRDNLLAWYKSNKRDLPWRHKATIKDDNQRAYADFAHLIEVARDDVTSNPPVKLKREKSQTMTSKSKKSKNTPSVLVTGIDELKVWVSEIMLQQTQVATVVDYYNRWMDKWPTLQDLADATLEEVNEMWSGLGYYSRGRRLHEGAQKVVNDLKGQMPSTAAELLKQLPGVGRYTAGAIASIAFGQATGLVDGNVVRVFSRLRLIGADSAAQHTVDAFWSLANTTVHPGRPGDYNQALMELGATICTPKTPSCSSCPLSSLCAAYAKVKASKQENASKLVQRKTEAQTDDLPDIECAADNCKLCSPSDEQWDESLGVMNYPRKAKKKAPREEHTAVTVVHTSASDGETKYLIAQRPPTGLLANLWEFPSVQLTKTEKKERAAQRTEFLLNNFGVDEELIAEKKVVGPVVHVFSHIHATYEVESYRLTSPSPATSSGFGRETRWLERDKLLESALSTAMKKVFKAFEAQQKNAGKPAKALKRKRECSDSKDGKKQLGLAAFFKPQNK